MECLVLGHNYAKTGPMHSNDIKDQFLEMHAKGISLSRIATDLHVSQRTLVDWNRQLAPDIRALRAVHLEALHEQTLASREADLARSAKVQTNVEAAITERDFSWVDSDKLVRIYLDLRHEIRALRAADLSPLYEPPNPNLNLNLNLNPNPAPPSSAGILPAEPNDPAPSAPGTLPATHLCVTEPPAQDAHPTPAVRVLGDADDIPVLVNPDLAPAFVPGDVAVHLAVFGHHRGLDVLLDPLLAASEGVPDPGGGGGQQPGFRSPAGGEEGADPIKPEPNSAEEGEAGWLGSVHKGRVAI